MPRTSWPARLRAICLALPEATDGVTVHHPNYNVRGKTFVTYSEPGDDRRPTLWVKTTREIQAELVASDGERFFVPPYLGAKGWVGVYVDRGADWTELAELVTDAYRLAAPKSLVKQLDA